MINRALRLLRTFSDLSQKELASQLGISNSYISEIESGIKQPTLDLIYKYADHFKVPASSIVLFSEKLDTNPGRARLFLTNLVLSSLEKINGEDEHEEEKERAPQA